MTELSAYFSVGDIPYQSFIPCAYHDKCGTSANLAANQKMECVKYLF